MPILTGELHRSQARYSPVNFTEYLRFLMPANTSGFVERQLDSAGERTGASAYFHRLGKAIVTFGTPH